MFTIRKKQIAAIAEAKTKKTDEEIVRSFMERLVQLGVDINVDKPRAATGPKSGGSAGGKYDDRTARTLIETGMAKARSYNILSEQDLFQFITFCFTIEELWYVSDTAKEILGDTERPAAARLKELYRILVFG